MSLPNLKCNNSFLLSIEQSLCHSLLVTSHPHCLWPHPGYLAFCLILRADLLWFLHMLNHLPTLFSCQHTPGIMLSLWVQFKCHLLLRLTPDHQIWWDSSHLFTLIYTSLFRFLPNNQHFPKLSVFPSLKTNCKSHLGKEFKHLIFSFIPSTKYNVCHRVLHDKFWWIYTFTTRIM